MVLAVPDTFQPARRLDVNLSLLADAKPLRDRARVHLHAYTFETVAEVILHEGKKVDPGSTALAQLRLQDPTLLLPDDRFIIRQFSPVVTIGGGVVLDTLPVGKPAKAETISFLRAVQAGSLQEVLAARVVRRGRTGLTTAQAITETGWRPTEIDATARTLADERQIVRIGDTLVSAAGFDDAKAQALATVDAFHRSNPLVPGIGKEELREAISASAPVFGGVLLALVAEKKLQLSGELVHAAGRGVVMKDEEAEAKKIIERAFSTAGLKVPALKEVLAGLPIDAARAQKIVTLLLRDKVLVKISDDLVFHRDALDHLRRTVAAQKPKSPRIDVGQFKDLTGVSRKYAIPLLEWLDRERVTRRIGDAREIL